MRYKALIEGNNFLLPGETTGVGFFATLTVEVGENEDIIESLRHAGIKKIRDLGLIKKNILLVRSFCVIKEVWQDVGDPSIGNTRGATFFPMGKREIVAAMFSRIFVIIFRRRLMVIR